MMLAKKFLVIGVYDGEGKLIGIGVNDEKTRKTVLYDVEEMGFDQVADFLEHVAKNGDYKKSKSEDDDK